MLAKGNKKTGSSWELQLLQERAVFGSQLISQCWKLMHLRLCHSHPLFPTKTFYLCWACHSVTRVKKSSHVRGPQDCQIQPVAYSLPSKIAVGFKKVSGQATSTPWGALGTGTCLLHWLLEGRSWKSLSSCTLSTCSAHRLANFILAMA